MSDPEGSFAVYCTTNLDGTALLEALNNGAVAEDNPFILISDDSFRDLGAQAVIEHHRIIEIPKNRTHKSLLIIADRSLPRGVLMVNLQPYHGYVDAIRQAPGLAGDSVASMSIANTDWYENRENIEPEQQQADMVPENHFALYNTLEGERNDSFEVAMKWMNDGVGELGLDDDDDDPPRVLPLGYQRSYYRAVPAPRSTLDEIREGHDRRARSLNIDVNFFAVVDSEWEDRGVIIARTSEATSFRCKVPVAGEMLNWIFIGLMTWEEAETQYANR